MNEKIAIIASYNGIFEIAQKAGQELNCDIKLIYGELAQGVEKAQKLIHSDPHRIIISRGGTATLLKANNNTMPIVEIKVTGYDILRVLFPLLNQNKKIAVIGFENTIRGALEITDILGKKIDYYPIFSETEIQSNLYTAKNNGAEIIVGDGLAVRFAKQMHMQTYIIESGKEAVYTAIEEAVKIYHAMALERLKNRNYQTILDSIDEGVISIKEDNSISIFNHSAEKIFQIKREIALGKKIENIIASTEPSYVLKTQKEICGAIQKTAKYTLVTNHIPVIVDNKIKGVVSTFQDITKIQQMEAKIRAETIKKGFQSKKGFQDIICKSSIMKEIIQQAQEYAKTDSTVLIYGESGTGKEIFAQAIHNKSNRNFAPFVAVNCAALPNNLLESELFGYVDGAFTGARKSGKKGLFEMAHGGTIFLDEISEMDLTIQARFLRVIQEKEVMRIGDDKVIPIDVRIITATNKNLWQCIQSKSFRKDLYYRINVLNLNLPPLRERKEDIAPLAAYFIEFLSHKYNKTVKPLGEKERKLLEENDWMGNIRELQNVLERYVISGKLQIDSYETADSMYQMELLEGTLLEIESRIAKLILAEENYNKTNTARRLGITRMTLDKKLLQK